MSVAASISGVPSRVSVWAHVVASEPLCRDHFRLTLSVATFPPSHPGQFVQLLCRSEDGVDSAEQPQSAYRGEGDAWPVMQGDDFRSPAALLQRPFSLAGRTDAPDGVKLVVIHRVIGAATGWLSRLSVGDMVGVLGPVGNGFTLSAEDQPAALVGGGVGIPPMLYLADRMSGQRVTAICGAMSRELLPLTLQENATRPIVEFAERGHGSVVTTDDGSAGIRGRVTVALGAWMQANAARRPIVYACGPEAMLKAVAAMAQRFGVACQIAVERAMACGLGTCQSCCIRVRKPDASSPPMAGSDWCYRLACTDGPVFAAADLLW